MARLLMGATERWLQAPAAGTKAAMEILLIIRFCCNCTYGNPGPSPGRRRGFPPLGAGWSGAYVWLPRFGGSREGNGCEWEWPELGLPLFWPASSLELKSRGCAGQGGSEMEGADWKHPSTPVLWTGGELGA